MTLTQGHGCGIDYQKFACLCNKVRTTHWITTKHGYCPSHGYYLIRFWRSSVGNFYFGKFSIKNLDVFFQDQTILAISQEWLVRLKWNEKEVYRLDTGYNVNLTFDLTHDLDLGCFKVKFRNSSISEIVGLIDVKWKGSELIWYWAHCMTWPFDHTHNLDPGVEISRSKSEIALSQEWDGRSTWNEKDVSHPFMTMILTSVTMVGWADVPDNDGWLQTSACRQHI